MRIPLILNKGRKGIPLQQLARISYELQQFLGLLGADPFASTLGIAEPMTVGELVEFGLPKSDADEQTEEWCELTKQQALLIASEVQPTVRSHGGVQGVIHSVFFGASPAHFQLRELSTGELVKCVYSSRKQYDGADAIHLASTMELKCNEFLTWDERPHANGDALNDLALAVRFPRDSQCLPDEYRQQQLITDTSKALPPASESTVPLADQPTEATENSKDGDK